MDTSLITTLSGVLLAGSAAWIYFRGFPFSRKGEGVAGNGDAVSEAAEMPSIGHIDFSAGVPPVPADVLLSRYGHLLSMIKDGLGMNDDEWGRLAYPIIQKLSDYFQLLPASERDHHIEAGGLLLHALEAAYLALVESRKVDFVSDEDREKKGFLSDRWAYAAFLGGLLHDIGKPVTDMVVFDVSSGEKWNPLVSTLYEWASQNGVERYSFQYRESRKYEDHESVNALILNEFVTEEAKAYLSDPDVHVLEAFLFAVINKGSAVGRPKFKMLERIIATADSTSVSREKKKYKSPKTLSTGTFTLADQAIWALIKLIEENGERKRWKPNVPGSTFFVTKNGVFAVWDDKKSGAIRDFSKEKELDPRLSRLPDLAITQTLVDGGVFWVVEGRKAWKAEISIPKEKWRQNLSVFMVAHPDVIEALFKRLTLEQLEAVTVQLTDPNGDLKTLPKHSREAIQQGVEALSERAAENGEVEEAGGGAHADSVGSQPKHEPNSVSEPETLSAASQDVKKGGKDVADIPATGDPADNDPADDDKKSAVNRSRGGEGAESDQAGQERAAPPSETAAAPQTTNISEILNDVPPVSKRRIKREGDGRPNGGDRSNKTTSTPTKDQQADTPPPREPDMVLPPSLEILDDMGEAGEMLAAILISIRSGATAKEAVLVQKDGQVYLMWPDAFRGHGMSERKLLEILQKDSAALAIKKNAPSGRRYIREIQLKGGRTAEAVLLAKTYADPFRTAYHDLTGNKEDQPRAQRQENNDGSIKGPQKAVQEDKKGAPVDKGDGSDKKKAAAEPKQVRGRTKPENSDTHPDSRHEKAGEESSPESSGVSQAGDNREGALAIDQTPKQKDEKFGPKETTGIPKNYNSEEFSQCKRLFKTFDYVLSTNMQTICAGQRKCKFFSIDSKSLVIKKQKFSLLIKTLNNMDGSIYLDEQKLKSVLKDNGSGGLLLPKSCAPRSYETARKLKEQKA